MTPARFEPARLALGALAALTLLAAACVGSFPPRPQVDGAVNPTRADGRTTDAPVEAEPDTAAGADTRVPPSAIDAPVDVPIGAADAPDASATPQPEPSMAPTCSPGSRCVPDDNPCVLGERVCAADANTCRPTSTAQANGTPCGANMVCFESKCVPCSAGGTCPVTGKPCRVGTHDCASGQQRCLETGDVPDGQGCGGNNVCKGGMCVPCGAGNTCVPVNPCHQGMQSCAPGQPCIDTGQVLPPGSSCGLNKVCNASGVCVDCRAGATCMGSPCKVGQYQCGSGSELCTDVGNAPNGTSCGQGRVCLAGECRDCAAGASCTPSNPCHAGVLSCTSGPACDDTGNFRPDGTRCGDNLYCNGGTCVPCTPGIACTPTSNPCRRGTTTCATGTSQCQETGNARDGDMCGPMRYCHSGSCGVCDAGAACKPTNVCKLGTNSCANGTADCQETGNAADGTTCGAQRECESGACRDCGVDTRRCCTGGGCRNANSECRNGTCQPRCVPDTDAVFCTRAGRNCGPFTAEDNCRMQRTVTCGTCSAARTCGGAGMPGQCGCLAAWYDSASGCHIDLGGQWLYTVDANPSTIPAVSVVEARRETAAIAYNGGDGSMCGCNGYRKIIRLGQSFDCSNTILEFHAGFAGSPGFTNSAAIDIRFCDAANCASGVPAYNGPGFSGSNWGGHSNCAWRFPNNTYRRAVVAPGVNVVPLKDLNRDVDGFCTGSFDAIDVHLQAYACFATEQGSVRISNLRLYQR